MAQHLSLAHKTHHLLQIEGAIDSVLCVLKATDTTSATADVERRVSTAITSAWRASANTAVSSAIKGVKPTKRSVAAFLKRLGVKLSNPLTKKQAEIIAARINTIWQISKKLAAKEVGVKVSFGLVDKAAIKAINRHQVFWVNGFYSKHLSERIRAVSEDVMLNQGLGSKAAGTVLKRALRRELGIVAGGQTAFADAVPARYAGNPDLYFRQVASTAAHQARTFAKVQQFDEAEITTYQLINPDDERTGKICQQMSGQVFSVQTGVKHMESILGAETPEDVKDIAPWLSGGELEKVLGTSKKGSDAATQKLVDAGAILPPFHGLCRTEPVILS